MKTLLCEGTICTFDNEQRVVAPGYLGIDEGAIAFVGEAIPSGFSPDRSIDCEGCILLPGLVNTHVHLGEQLLKGWMDERNFEGLFYSHLFSWEANLDPQLVYWGSLASAVDALRCGVTTVGDMYHHAEATAQAVADCGIRACLGQKILGFSLCQPPQLTSSGIDYHFDQGAFEEQLSAACEFADRWNGKASGRITTALTPHATNTLKMEMLERVAEAAQVHSSLVHIHLAQMESEYEEVHKQYGIGCVELLAKAGLLKSPLLGAHAIFLDPGEEKLLAENQATVAHNPVANAKDAGLIAPVTRLQSAGVTIGLGTDAFHMNLLQTARFAAFLHRVHTNDADVCSAREVLGWATGGGAKALGLEGSVGSLQQGKRADLVVFDVSQLNTTSLGDPFTTILYYAEPRNIRLVMVDGMVVARDGKILTVDTEEVKREFSQAIHTLQRRIERGKAR